jgi:tetratricopeptide (TPR) repeat protein
MKTSYIAFSLALMSAMPVMAIRNVVSTDNVEISTSEGFLNVSADLRLDSMKLGANKQVFITPVVRGSNGEEVVLPSLLVNGRNMHYAYERGSLKGFDDIKNHDILLEVKRDNGKPQSVEYITRTPLQKWMRLGDSHVAFVYDSCGCGVQYASLIEDDIPLELNPAKEMRTVMMTPAVKELPVEIHEGRARVQFEVDKTVLHPEPYTCRNGQKIDNRAQLKMIDDSVRYALSDPNVEIAEIAICGYASPESPYLHNEYLATNRSRALAEYLADRYNLPRERCTYSSVPENWQEFREEVLSSKEITEQQRKDLLELIDRPAYGPSDYDAKEKELKTSPKFAKLYSSTILPKWFPRLRATTFAISTRLKPMSDQELAKIIETSPEKMSLNQMFRVARLYPEGSKEFNRIIGIALAHYPDDPTANLNAAAAKVSEGDYEGAKSLLTKASDSKEVWNLRGIIATAEGEFEKAHEYFMKAGNLPEAEKNADMLK